MNERVAQVEADMGLASRTDHTMTNLISMVNDVMATYEDGTFTDDGSGQSSSRAHSSASSRN